MSYLPALEGTWGMSDSSASLKGPLLIAKFAIAVNGALRPTYCDFAIELIAFVSGLEFRLADIALVF